MDDSDRDVTFVPVPETSEEEEFSLPECPSSVEDQDIVALQRGYN